MYRLAFAALLLSAATAHAEGVSLPLGFDGLYAPEGLPCAGSQRIAVAEGEFSFPGGGSWTITDLIEFPGEADRVEVSLLVRSAGSEMTESAVLLLDRDGQAAFLVFDYADGTRNIWERCEDLP